MDLYEAINTRRTIHKYEPTPVDKAIIERILRAGHRAPNHKHTWPWRFTTVGPQTRSKIVAAAIAVKAEKKELSESKKESIAAKITNPGGMIVVSQVRCDDPFRSKEDYAATCCAIQNMMLAARAEGFGSKWSTGGVTRSPATYEALGINPETEEIVAFIWVGTPAKEGKVERPPIEDHVRSLP